MYQFFVDEVYRLSTYIKDFGEEGQEYDQRAGAPLLWRKIEGVESLHPGEDKTVGDLNGPSRSYKRELTSRREIGFLHGELVTGQGLVVLN